MCRSACLQNPHTYLVLAVGGGGVPVHDPVALGQAQPARVTDAGVGLLLVNYLPINCIFSVFIFQRVDISTQSRTVSVFLKTKCCVNSCLTASSIKFDSFYFFLTK